uniref:Uncharacterized protein n=1 Tax=Oryza barthii TaxID=65489 RepID=A0A0D3HQA2_9ORYZ
MTTWTVSHGVMSIDSCHVEKAIAFMGIPSKDVLLQHQPQLALGCVTRKENFGCDGKLGVWGKFGVI